MPYTKWFNPWHDAASATGGGDMSTPLTASALDHIEAGIAAAIPADIVDAKGDMIVATTADTVARLAIGNADEVASVSGGTVLWRKVGNAMVASDAAIAVSKLAPGSNGQVLATSAGTASWVDGATIVAVTALPSSPVDGQEILFTDSLSAPTYRWRLRYNAGSGSSYKWEFVGGTEKFVEVTTAEGTASTAYADLATVGPQFTIPRAGEWLFSWVALVTNSTATAITMAAIGLKIGSAGVADESAVVLPASAANLSSSIPATYVRAAAASDVVKLQYKSSAGTQTCTFLARKLLIRPVRIS